MTDHAPRHRLGSLLIVAAMLVGACDLGGPSAATSTPSSATPSSGAAGASTSPAPADPSLPAAQSPAVAPSGPVAGAFDPTGKTVTADVAASGLEDPVDVTNAGDESGRLFVAEQPGRIRIVSDRMLLAQPFLDITNRIASGGERGLLGLAFHPNYPTDPRFFVDYTDLSGDTVIASFQVTRDNPDLADADSEVVILRIDQPYPNHNGGAVEFGPDGKLYIAMGDGGSAGDPQGNGQRLDTLLAKILRIDIDAGAGSAKPYVIPAGNPFVDDPNAKPEIWLTGLRNPWRMRFDRVTGDLWIGDVGQGEWEEVDVARGGEAGLDYGWNTMEGFHCYRPSSGCDQTGLTLPVTEYDHDKGCAVIGGVVVRDAQQPGIDGGYLFGDACSDNLWLMDPAPGGRREGVIVAKLGRTLSAIGEGEDGAVYATSLDRGELLRLSAGPG